MTLNKKIFEYTQLYDVLGIINLDQWHELKVYQRKQWLLKTLQPLHKTEYTPNQRILITLTRNDIQENLLENLQSCLYDVDITNYYVVVLCNDPNVSQYWKTGKDTTAINFDFYHSDAMIVTAKKQSMYQYNSTDLVNAVDLTAREEFLLNESKTF